TGAIAVDELNAAVTQPLQVPIAASLAECRCGCAIEPDSHHRPIVAASPEESHTVAIGRDSWLPATGCSFHAFDRTVAQRPIPQFADAVAHNLINDEVACGSNGESDFHRVSDGRSIGEPHIVFRWTFDHAGTKT